MSRRPRSDSSPDRMQVLLDSCVLKIALKAHEYFILKNAFISSVQLKELTHDEVFKLKNYVHVLNNQSLKNVDHALSEIAIQNNLCLVTLDKNLLRYHFKNKGCGIHYKIYKSQFNLNYDGSI